MIHGQQALQALAYCNFILNRTVRIANLHDAAAQRDEWGKRSVAFQPARSRLPFRTTSTTHSFSLASTLRRLPAASARQSPKVVWTNVHFSGIARRFGNPITLADTTQRS